MTRASFFAALLLASPLLTVLVSSAQADPPNAHVQKLTTALNDLARARRYARRLERVVRREVSRAERNERKLRTARRVFRASLNESPTGLHPYEVAFQCIHRYEGSWTDDGAPYYGGLQFDRQFQKTYGPEFLQAFGTANRWPVSVQLAVAIRALVSGRGFHPWPNTARRCGLL